ncbi:HlyD family secretion protein [Sphingomonas faeni]|uniref:HlyD family secretion protein n=1 Tax=Sphingomonas faeni TaxID=185950 RepID=UPI0027D8D768|nr:HlyD family secretion protein [Sphingomonas faeni]
MSDRRYQETDDAYLAANLTPLGARVAGYVKSVPAQDFERVKAGQLLVLIDDDDYRASLAQAVASAEVARAAIGNLEAQQGLQKANIRAAAASVAASIAVAVKTGKAARRQGTLLTSGAGSEEQNEAADAANATAIAQVERDNAVHQAAVQQLVVLASQIRQARASLASALAAADISRINLGHTRITAPQAGVLGQRQVQPGQYLAVGGQVATLAPLPHIWVIANYKETQLAHIRVGQAATLTIDAFPGHVIHGRVSGYAPGTGSQFALLPPDNATGNFTKIVQRLAVKIRIEDHGDLVQRLRPGMSVTSTVDTKGG